MEDKIKELKNLAIARECALEFDYCPEESEADYIIENILDCNKDDLIAILNKYQGWSCDNIESVVFQNIRHL